MLKESQLKEICQGSSSCRIRCMTKETNQILSVHFTRNFSPFATVHQKLFPIMFASFAFFNKKATHADNDLVNILCSLIGISRKREFRPQRPQIIGSGNSSFPLDAKQSHCRLTVQNCKTVLGTFLGLKNIANL